MIHLSQAVIVEGKYDKIKLSSVIDAVIITTDGFSVFKNKEKLELIRYYAANTGIIILTDSDTAGFKIRNFLKGAIKNGRICNVYIPDIFGKERRKNAPSKEGKLGVEGVDIQIIMNAFDKAGITSEDREERTDRITKIDLFNCGMTGCSNSSEKRRLFLSALNLPLLLTTNGIVEIINTMMSKSEFYEYVNSLFEINQINER